jgi:hypothetical protein
VSADLCDVTQLWAMWPWRRRLRWRMRSEYVLRGGRLCGTRRQHTKPGVLLPRTEGGRGLRGFWLSQLRERQIRRVYLLFAPGQVPDHQGLLRSIPLERGAAQQTAPLGLERQPTGQIATVVSVSQVDSVKLSEHLVRFRQLGERRVITGGTELRPQRLDRWIAVCLMNGIG